MMKTKRLFSLILAVGLLLGAALPAGAAAYGGESDTTASLRVSMKAGERQDLSDLFQRSGGQGEDNDEIAWTLSGAIQWDSGSPGVVSVDGAGVATAHKVGTARVTATFSDNIGRRHLYTFVVGVTAAGNGAAAVVSDSFSVGEGKQLDLGALLFPGGQSGVVWTSSNETVAVVDETGFVTATGIGNCQIKAETAASDGSTVTRRVKLQVASMYTGDYLKTISFSLSSGATVDLMQVFYPQYVGTATAREITCTTGDREIVSVSGGEITAKAPGTVTVTLRHEKSADREDDVVQWFTVQVV